MNNLILLLAFVPLVVTGQYEHENTTLVGRWTDGPSYAVATSESILFCGNGGALDIIDFNSPENPELICKIEMPSRIHSILLNGDYVFVSSSGLHIIDISTSE